MRSVKYLFVLFLAGLSGMLRAQDVALRTNLFSAATTSMNLAAEVAVAPQWSIALEGSYNPWTFSDNKKIKHYWIQPAVRYWFCGRFNGHFVGLNIAGGEYNVGGVKIPLFASNTQKYRYEGWALSASASYGYAVPLHKNWNLEFELGLGVVHTQYSRFDCATCGAKLEGGVRKTFLAPTKLGVSVVFIIR